MVSAFIAAVIHRIEDGAWRKLPAQPRQTNSIEGKQVSVTIAGAKRARARRGHGSRLIVAHHMCRHGSGLVVLASFSPQLPVLFPPWQTRCMPFARTISQWLL